ncbi:MAG: ribosome maturation factor RimP [Bacillota bacterium]
MASRQDIEAKVERLALEVLEASGVSLVDVEYLRGKQNILRVYIYHPDGITLDDCEEVSRGLSDLLDRDDPVPGSYQLEVSSPGIERVIRKRREYDLFRGRLVQVNCKRPVEDQNVWQGVLLGSDGDSIELKTAQDKRVVIPLELVARAQLVYQD